MQVFSVNHEFSVINMTYDRMPSPEGDRDIIKSITIAKGDKRRANADGVVILEQVITIPYRAFADIAKEIMRINTQLREEARTDEIQGNQDPETTETNLSVPE